MLAFSLSGVAGAVIATVSCPPSSPSRQLLSPKARPVIFSHTTSRSATAALSIACFLSVSTVNKIRHSAMDSVIVTLMADAQSVCLVVSKPWKVFDWFNVMSFKSSVSATHSAFVTACIDDGFLPSQVFRASAALRLPIMLSLCQPHALCRAEEFGISSLAARLAGGLAALVARFLDSVVLFSASD